MLEQTHLLLNLGISLFAFPSLCRFVISIVVSVSLLSSLLPRFTPSLPVPPATSIPHIYLYYYNLHTFS